MIQDIIKKLEKIKETFEYNNLNYYIELAGFSRFLDNICDNLNMLDVTIIITNDLKHPLLTPIDYNENDSKIYVPFSNMHNVYIEMIGRKKNINTFLNNYRQFRKIFLGY